jgi:hypothetical protein
MWEWILATLAALSADPVSASLEHPRAAAAVAAARASMVAGDAAPTPTPAECVCGRTCVNGVWKPDGRVEQRCTCTCERCKKKPGCPDGKCRVPGASPASGSPAMP